MAKREKLSRRIINAYRALRGDPWPITFIEGPKITYTRPEIHTIGAETSCPASFIDLQGPEVTDAAARRDIATMIGKELLDTGAIKINRVIDFRADRICYHGRVRVVMPDKEE